MRRESFAQLLLLALLFASFYLLFVIIHPFFSALVWAAVLAVIFHPVNRLSRWALRDRKGLAALLTTVAALLLIVFPFAFLAKLLGKELVDAYKLLERSFAEGYWERLWKAVESSPLLHKVLQFLEGEGASFDLEAFVLENARRLALYLANQSSALIKGLSSALLQFILMVVALFYLFRDGDSILERLKGLLPFGPQEKEELLSRIVQMIQATIYGGLLVAVVQGALGGLGFLLVGLPSPVLWGTVMALLSFLPVVGAYLVWVPAALFLLLAGSYLKALILFGWGIAVVSTVDNFIRPLFISGRTKVHPLLLFFAILGGIKAFGLLGVVAAPLIVAFSLAMLDFYTRSKEGASEPYTE